MYQSQSRLLSLDLFKGLTICFFIIVNSQGLGALPFAPFLRTTWHGFKPSDLVFPSVLFAAGNTISFVTKKYNKLKTHKILLLMLRRAVILFTIGYLLCWFPFIKYSAENGISFIAIENTRILGVLQRTALCALFASFITYYIDRFKVVIICAIFLIGYWIVLSIFGDAENPLSITGNVGVFIDKYILGESHLYKENDIIFDSEGLLSTLPATVNVLAGYYAGRLIKRNGKGYESIAKLTLCGAFLIFIALCWNLLFPINKKLWTSSFVLLTSGIDLIILPAIIYFAEIRKNNFMNWTIFLRIFGKHSLIIYIISEVLLSIMRIIPVNGTSLYEWISLQIFQRIVPGNLGALLFSISFMLLCWLICYAFIRKRVYVTI